MLFPLQRSTSLSYLIGLLLVYPERLLVYHAGTGKTVFIGCLKVTTILLFTASCVILAPMYVEDTETNWGMIVASKYHTIRSNKIFILLKRL